MTSDPTTFDFLYNKTRSWNIQSSLELHGSDEKTSISKSYYVWEELDNGYLHYGPKMATYYNNNGTESVLTQSYVNCFAEDIKANKQLANMIPCVNPIRFDQEAKDKNITRMIDDVAYTYYIVEHPGGIGTPVSFLNEPVKTLEIFIEQVTLVIPHIQKILEDTSIRGFPSVRVSSLLQNDDGYYWRFLYHWKFWPQGFYAKLVGEIEMLEEYLSLKEKDNSLKLIENTKKLWADLLKL